MIQLCDLCGFALRRIPDSIGSVFGEQDVASALRHGLRSFGEPISNVWKNGKIIGGKIISSFQCLEDYGPRRFANDQSSTVVTRRNEHCSGYAADVSRLSSSYESTPNCFSSNGINVFPSMIPY